MFIHLDQSAKEEVDSGEKIGESHDVATRGDVSQTEICSMYDVMHMQH